MRFWLWVHIQLMLWLFPAAQCDLHMGQSHQPGMMAAVLMKAAAHICSCVYYSLL
jgi:hypothetical protein